MTRRLLVVLMATSLAFAGCGQQPTDVALQERQLPRPNPTTYEFDAPLSDVKGAIQRAYEDWHFETSKTYGARSWQGSGDAVSKRVHTRALQLVGHSILLWKGDGDGLSKGLLTKPGNEDDAYLSGQEAPFSESQVYFKDGQPLIYYSDFHIHITAIGTRKTRVNIFTYDSKVAAHVDERFSPVHGPGFDCVAVTPSTIEEYDILRRIGKQLGTKDMPELATPGSNSPVRQMTKPITR